MNDSIEHSAIFDLMVRVLSGEATSAEKEKLQLWIDEDTENLKAFDSYRKTWEAMEKVRGLTSDDIDSEWDKLENRIDIIDAQHNLSSREHNKTFTLYRVAAAIVFFMIAAFSVYYYFEQAGEQKWKAGDVSRIVELPDGTRVTLNNHSSLALEGDFSGQLRKVSLVGEAFFEVVRNTQKPFVIQTDDVKIEVLGTSFNVNAYGAEEKVEVIVNSGKVAVYKHGNKKEKIILLPGEKGVYIRPSKSLTSMVNNDVNYLAWKTKKLIFEDMPLNEVVKTLNRVYQSNLVIMDERMMKCPITSTFENQSLDVIMEVLKATLNLKTTENKGSIEIRGDGC